MNASAPRRRLTGAFVNTHPAQCSIYESGAMVAGCLQDSALFDLHCVTLADIDLDELRRSRRLVSSRDAAPRDYPAQFDFWIFNWHFVTMAGHVQAQTIAALDGLKFTVVLELAEHDALVHVPKNTFDGYLALDPQVPQQGGVFPFPRPLQGTPMQGERHGRAVPVIASFGFGTPAKGFELLVEAVGREFDRAIVRINVPIGDYAAATQAAARVYADHMATRCRQVARPGIEVQFTNDFLGSDELIGWCHQNDLNCFMYTRDQPGLSATTDQAILSGQPLLTLTNATFRHIHPYIAPYPLLSLRQAMERTMPAVAAMQRDWSKAHFRRRFEVMLKSFGAVPADVVLPAGDGTDADAETDAGTDNVGPAVRRTRVLVLHRPDDTPGDLASYGTRFVNALSRATTNARKAVCTTIPMAVAAILDAAPDVVITLDHGDEWAAQLAACWAGGRPFRLLNASADRGGVAMDAGPPPIIPFFTNGITAPVTSVAWLIGFEAGDAALDHWLQRIANETAIGRIAVEAAARDRNALAAHLGRHGPLQRADGSLLYVEVVTLPEHGDLMLQKLAHESVLIFHAGVDTLARTEAICSLSLSTERAVVFDATAPLPSFGDALCLDDSQALQGRIDRGIAGQIAVVHQRGEWALAARWLPRIDAADDDAPPATATAGDAGAAIAFSGLDQLDDEDFVGSLHRGLLGRDATDLDLRQGLDALWAGRTRSEFAGAVARSALALARLALHAPSATAAPAAPAAQGRDGAVGLVDAYLHAWLAELTALDDADFVRAAYRGGLGRDPERAGLDGHRALIENGYVRLFVFHAIAGSPEADLRGGERVLGRIDAPAAQDEAGVIGAAWIRWLARLDGDAFRHEACRFFLGRRPQAGELDAAATGTAHARFNALQALADSAEAKAWAVDVAQAAVARRVSALRAARQQPAARSEQAAAGAAAAPAGDAAAGQDMAGARRHPVLWVLAGTADSDVPDMARRLSSARSAAGQATITIAWNRERRKLEHVGKDAAPSGRFLSSASCRLGDWLLLPGGFVPQVDELPEVDVLMAARALGLRSAGLFFGAEALEDASAAGRHCERHMQALLLADLVLPVSSRARDEIQDVFAQHHGAVDAPPIVKMALPLGFAGEDSTAWDVYNRQLRALFRRTDAERDRVCSVVYLDRRFDAGDSGLAPMLQLLRDRGVDVLEVVLRDVRVVPTSNSRPGARAPTWLLVDGELPAAAVAVVREFAAQRRLRVAALSPAAAPAFDFKPYLEFDRIITGAEPEYRALQAQVLRTRQRLPDAESRFVYIEEAAPAGHGPKPRINGAPRRAACRFAVLAATGSGDDLVAAALAALGQIQTQSRRAVEVCVHLPPGAKAPSGGRWAVADTVEEALHGADVALALGNSGWARRIATLATSAGVPTLVPHSAGLDGMSGVVPMRVDAAGAIEAAAWRLLDDAWRDTLRTEALLRPRRSSDDHADDVLRCLANDDVFRDLQPVQASQRGSIHARLPGLQRRPVLSVCISTYNRAGWLGLNLKNLFRQLGPTPVPDLEVVVVDNAATDDTPQVVQPYLGRSDFRYYRNPINVGMLGNLAVTAQRAEGWYVWIIGDDDLTQPDAVTSVLAALQAHPQVAMAYVNYGYTSVADPSSVVDFDAHLSKFNVLEPDGPDALSTIADIAANNENFYTAIYACVFQRAHALRAFCLNTAGRPFSTMLTCIPTSYYALHHMSHLPAYWLGKPLLVVNSNVSWAPYGPLFDLEQLPRAWDLAERKGTPPAAVDLRRTNRLWLVEMMWRDMFENDVANNSPYFSAARVLTRLKHLPAIDERIPEMLAIYRRAHRNGNPAATLAPEALFAAWQSA